MAEDVIKLPVVNLEIPKPKRWDFVALVITLVGVGASVANMSLGELRQPGASISTGLSMAFATVGLAVCLGSLLALGKTAKEGTIHGNLFALAGMLVGLGGIMLAAALWAIG